MRPSNATAHARPWIGGPPCLKRYLAEIGRNGTQFATNLELSYLQADPGTKRPAYGAVIRAIFNEPCLVVSAWSSRRAGRNPCRATDIRNSKAYRAFCKAGSGGPGTD